MLEEQVWGQGFVTPSFCDPFEVIDQRIVGGRHLKLRLQREGADRPIDAIRFGDDTNFPEKVECVYRLQLNEFKGVRTAQLVIEHWRPL
jgi:single-stranded-DNA-specific exonuclease